MSHPWFLALLGGALIGAASALLLLTHGRIAGVSGIVGQIVRAQTRDRDWRFAFGGGLLATGLIARVFAPEAIGAPTRSLVVTALAGLIVGVGTSLGNGCTSGHGVCGLSRLSLRSAVAVGTFMLTGGLTVALVGGAR